MSRGVGYIAGVSLDELQTQWGALLEQDVDVILFDRTVLRTPHKPGSSDPIDVENNKIWQWSHAMVAGQDFSGNYDRYRAITDLQPGDALVLTRLNVLFHAYSGAWSEFMAAYERGIQLIVLEYGFHSGGEYGDVMIEKMNTMFELGSNVCAKEMEGTGVVNNAIQRLETSNTGPIYCPVCGQKVVVPEEGQVNACAHTLFVAHNDGFEYRSQQFDEAMGIVGVDSEDIVLGEHKYDGFTDKLAINNAVKFVIYSGAPGYWTVYVGFVVD